MNVIQDNRSPQAPDRPLDQKFMTSAGSSLCPGEGFASYLKMIISHQKGKNIETFARKHHALLSLPSQRCGFLALHLSMQFLGLENWENWLNLIVQTWLKWNKISVWLFFRAIIWNLIFIGSFARKAAPTKEGWAQVFLLWWWFVFNVCIVPKESSFESLW